MTVKFEPVRTVGPERWQDLATQMSDRIHQALHVRLKCAPVPPDTLPRYELKTKRIIDQRPKEFRRALDR
jgi:phenylacetate-coenzyme A ligase PaaK-like adenylate-forming protein